MAVQTNIDPVRTPAGTYAKPDDERTPNVRDRSAEVREHVWRALLRTALGEAYKFDVVPVCAPDGTGGVEVGYVLYVSTALPVPIGARVAVASKPFEFDAGEELIGRIVSAVVESLRKARSEALRQPQTR
jgi:hypothetical protein